MREVTMRGAARAFPTRAGAPLVRILVVALVVAAALPTAVTVRPLSSGLLAVLVLAVCAWGLVAACDRGTRPAQLVFWAFSLSWLGVAPLYQLSVGQVAWGDHTLLAQRDAVVTAQLLVLLSLVSFLVGSRLGADTPPRRVTELDPARTVRAAGVVIGLAVLLLPAAAQASGGFASLFVSRRERSLAIDAAGVVAAEGGGATLGLVKLLPAALATVGCYFAVLALREEVRRRRAGDWRLTRIAAVLAGVAVLLVYSNPVANSRFISFAAIGCCVLAACAPRSVRAGAALAVSAVIGLLFAYPLLYALRRPDGLGGGKFTLSDWSGPDFDGFQQWVNTVLYVDDRGPVWGDTIVSALLFWVPRSLWEGKATPASITVAEYRGYRFTDLSLPVSAELYLNLGVVGVVVGMLVLGRLWARLDHAWLTAPGSLAAVLAPIVATQQFGLIRGPMGSLAPVIGSVVLLSIAVVAYGRRRERGGGTR